MAAMPYRRCGGLVLLAAAGAVAFAACGGSKAPSVANLGTTTTVSAGDGSAAPTGAKSTPSQLLDEWAACMRKHGDPNQVDPSITADKVIEITWNPSIPGGFNGTNKGGQGNSGPGQYCRTYLNKAQTALQGPQENPSQAQVLKFSECVRANGIRDFPDPGASGLHMSVGGDLNPQNPAFQHASKVCSQKTGVPGLGGPQAGTIELTGGARG